MFLKYLICFVALNSVALASLIEDILEEDHHHHKMGFKMDKKRDTFLLDGRPFRYMSGSMHYFRVHPDLWEDRLTKLKAAGFNAVQTYIEWNTHEEKEGAYCFEGICDVGEVYRVGSEGRVVGHLKTGALYRRGEGHGRAAVLVAGRGEI